MPKRSDVLSWLSSLYMYLEEKHLRIGIVGCSGSGKTSLVRAYIAHLLRRRGRAGYRVIIFDPLREYSGRLVHTPRQLLRSARNKYSVTRFSDAEIWGRIAPIVLRAGHCSVVLDEAHEVYPRYGTTAAASSVITKGRHNAISILWATQRPSRCNTDLLGNTTGVLVGRLMAPADMRWQRGWGILDVQDFYRFSAVLPGREPFIVQSEASRY